jgi:hypothetical protein
VRVEPVWQRNHHGEPGTGALAQVGQISPSSGSTGEVPVVAVTRAARALSELRDGVERSLRPSLSPKMTERGIATRAIGNGVGPEGPDCRSSARRAVPEGVGGHRPSWQRSVGGSLDPPEGASGGCNGDTPILIGGAVRSGQRWAWRPVRRSLSCDGAAFYAASGSGGVCASVSKAETNCSRSSAETQARACCSIAIP